MINKAFGEFFEGIVCISTYENRLFASECFLLCIR